jgi:indolepyruvate ferredoxin oxidoreductase beta subunit
VPRYAPKALSKWWENDVAEISVNRSRRRPVNVLIVGVGGQGVLLAGEVLANAAVIAGLDVKKSEVHGMAQRGGSVISHLRFGKVVHSPLISRGEADFLISFEKLETLRYLDYLHPSSWVLVNDQEILPLPVSTGRLAYPRGIHRVLETAGVQFKIIDGVSLAARAGNAKAVNAVILGVLAKLLPFPGDAWEKALQGNVPERYLAANMKAFELGKRRRLK